MKQSMAKALAEVVKSATRDERGLVVKRNTSEVERRLLSLKLRGLSELTTSAYHNDVRDYVRFAGETERAPGDADTLEAFKRHLMRTGARPTTVNRKLVGVKRTLLEYARREYKAAGVEALRNLYRDVKLLKLGDGERHVSREKLVTEAEAQRLIAGAPERVGLVMEFLFQTGARVSEALGVKLSDVKVVNAHAEVVVVGKGGKARTLLVKSELLERIRREFKGRVFLFETRLGKPFSRSYVRREFVRASERELGKRVSPHSARHSFATWTLARTKKVKGLSEYLGHADTSTTLNLYVHEKLSPEELLGDGLEASHGGSVSKLGTFRGKPEVSPKTGGSR